MNSSGACRSIKDQSVLVETSDALTGFCMPDLILSATCAGDLTLFNPDDGVEAVDQPDQSIEGSANGDRAGGRVLCAALLDTHDSLLSDEVVSQRYPA
jgi:hypothetical protein